MCSRKLNHIHHTQFHTSVADSWLGSDWWSYIWASSTTMCYVNTFSRPICLWLDWICSQIPTNTMCSSNVLNRHCVWDPPASLWFHQFYQSLLSGFMVFICIYAGISIMWRNIHENIQGLNFIHHIYIKFCYWRKSLRDKRPSQKLYQLHHFFINWSYCLFFL